MPKFHLAYIKLFILLVLASSYGCYEHSEGCIDARAENYDLEADKACEDCCTYPSLKMEFEHWMNGELIDTNFTWANGEDSIRIRSLNFYLSQFSLEEGSQHESASSIAWISILPQNSTDNIFETYNFPVAKVKLGKSDPYDLGTFKEADIYQQISFDFGIEEKVNHANMDQILSSNALYDNQDELYIGQNEGFYFLRMILEINGTEEKIIEISGDENRESFTFNANFDFSEREDRVIRMNLAYELWFENIVFGQESPEIIAEKLKTGLSNSLFFD
jgi:hypothetical protein